MTDTISQGSPFYIGAVGETLEEAVKNYDVIEATIYEASQVIDRDATKPINDILASLMFNTRVWWYETARGIGTNEENLREMTLTDNFTGTARLFREAVKAREGIEDLENYMGLQFVVYATKEKTRRIAGISI